MKVYVVMQAPERLSDDFVTFPGLLDDPQAVPFLDRAEAEDRAREAARTNRGVKFWVVEGEPVVAFLSEPAAVDEVAVDV